MVSRTAAVADSSPCLAYSAIYVDLNRLGIVVLLQRLVVGLGEAAFALLVHADGHGRGEYAHALVEANNFLLVQPQDGGIELLVASTVLRLLSSLERRWRILARCQGHCRLAEGFGQGSPGGGDQQVLAPGPLGQEFQQELQNPAGVVRPELGAVRDLVPFLSQADLDGVSACVFVS